MGELEKLQIKPHDPTPGAFWRLVNFAPPLLPGEPEKDIDPIVFL
jgi:hypothetical protein